MAGEQGIDVTVFKKIFEDYAKEKENGANTLILIRSLMMGVQSETRRLRELKEGEEDEKSKTKSRDKKTKDRWYETLVKNKWFKSTSKLLYNMPKNITLALLGGVISFLALALFDPSGALLTSIINMVVNLGVMLLGMLVRMVPGLAVVIAKLIPVIVQAIVKAVSAIADAAPIIVNALMAAFDAVIKGLPQIFAALIQAVMVLVPILIQGVVKMLPKVVMMLATYLVGLIGLFAAMLPKIFEGLVELIPAVVESLVAALPKVITAIVKAIPVIIKILLVSIPKIITELIKAVPEIINVLIAAFPEIIKAFVDVFSDPAMQKEMLAAFGELFSVLVKLLGSELPDLIFSVFYSLGKLLDNLFGTSFFADFFGWIADILTFGQRMLAALLSFDWKQIVSTLAGGLTDIFGPIVKLLVSGFLGLFSGWMDYIIVPVWTYIFKAYKLIWKLLVRLMKGIPILGDAFEYVDNLFSDLADSLSSAWSKLKSMFTIDTIIANARKKIADFFANMPGLQKLSNFFFGMVRKLKNFVAGLPFMGGVKTVGDTNLLDVFRSRKGNATEADILAKLASGNIKSAQAAQALGFGNDPRMTAALEKLAEGLKKVTGKEDQKGIEGALKDQVGLTKEMVQALKTLKSGNPAIIDLRAQSLHLD